MKYYKIIFFTICLLSLWALNSYADRLYTWEDKKGVAHISKEPPPNNTELIDIMDYKNHTEKPRNQKQADQKQQKNLNKKDAGGGEKSLETTGTTEDVVNDVYNDGRGDRYTRKVRREDKREERRDNLKDRQADDKSNPREKRYDNQDERHEKRDDMEKNDKSNGKPLKDQSEHRESPHRK